MRWRRSVLKRAQRVALLGEIGVLVISISSLAAGYMIVEFLPAPIDAPLLIFWLIIMAIVMYHVAKRFGAFQGRPRRLISRLNVRTLCVVCGYNRVGLDDSTRCPECGV